MNPQLETIIQSCTDNQDKHCPNWSVEAINKLRAFIIFKDEFITEEFRQWAFNAGLPEPRNNKAFGGVMRLAESLGIIRKTDKYRSTGIKSHHRPMIVWEGVKR